MKSDNKTQFDSSKSAPTSKIKRAVPKALQAQANKSPSTKSLLEFKGWVDVDMMKAAMEEVSERRQAE
jgi:hypothetical protein